MERLCSLAWSTWSFNSFLSPDCQNSWSLSNSACKHHRLLVLPLKHMQIKTEPWNTVRNAQPATACWAQNEEPLLCSLLLSLSLSCISEMQNSNSMLVSFRVLEKEVIVKLGCPSHVSLTSYLWLLICHLEHQFILLWNGLLTAPGELYSFIWWWLVKTRSVFIHFSSLLASASEKS